MIEKERNCNDLEIIFHTAFHNINPNAKSKFFSFKFLWEKKGNSEFAGAGDWTRDLSHTRQVSEPLHYEVGLQILRICSPFMCAWMVRADWSGHHAADLLSQIYPVGLLGLRGRKKNSLKIDNNNIMAWRLLTIPWLRAAAVKVSRTLNNILYITCLQIAVKRQISWWLFCYDQQNNLFMTLHDYTLYSLNSVQWHCTCLNEW